MKKLSIAIILTFLGVGMFGITSKAAGVVDLDPTTEVTTEVTTESVNDLGGNDEPNVSIGMDNGITISNGESLTDPDAIYPKVDAENFFQRTYRKLLEGTNFYQRVIAILLVVCFVTCAFMTVVSLVGQKGRVIYFVIGMLICAICFVADLYAIPIMNAFNAWFNS